MLNNLNQRYWQHTLHPQQLLAFLLLPVELIHPNLSTIRDPLRYRILRLMRRVGAG